MNDHDRNNLNFILSLDTREKFDQWAQTLSVDDMQYAIDLIKRQRSEIMLQTLEFYDDVEDTAHAKNILKGFML